jgi:hypothetical protein
MQAMGLILDAAGDFSFDSFRLAWTVQYAIWVLAVVGILITRRKARRLIRLELGALPSQAGGPPARGEETILLGASTRTSPTGCAPMPADWPS